MTNETEFWIKANRLAVVTRVDIFEVLEGSHPRPKAEQLSDGDSPSIRRAIEAGDPIWALWVGFKEGLDEEDTFFELYASEEAAIEASASYLIGQEFKPRGFLSSKSTDFDADNLSFDTKLSVMGRGEPPYGLLLNALAGAGVLNNEFRLSETVHIWLGESGTNKLKERFGENWSSVAVLEYCVHHFDETSLATLAARVHVADFIADRDYDAGYASREFEMLYSGAEKLALDAKSARHLAGIEGGNASRRRKLENLEALMSEIEKLSKAVGHISEGRIVSQAIETAQTQYPKMPKSKKTLEDYETALRSEEPFKSRYEAVFRKNA